MHKQRADPRYVKRAYTNPSQVGSYSGLATFVRNRNIKNIKQTGAALNEIPAYTLFRNRKKKITRSIILWQPFDLVSGDLIDLVNLKGSNRGYAYIFLFVDGFTKFVTVYKLKSKSIPDIKHALLQFIKQSKSKLTRLMTDHEPALMSREIQKLFKENHITHIASNTVIGASHAEIAIKNLKRRMFRMMEQTGKNTWINTLDDLVKSQNSSIHTSTGKRPAEIKAKDHSAVFMRLYSKLAQRKRSKPKFKLKELVYIAAPRVTFDRSFKPNWSRERFRISKIHTLFPKISYKLTDLQGSLLDGSYTESDLHKA